MKRRTFTLAAAGAVGWFSTPWLPVGSPPSFGSIEHVFLSMPLVAAPLALLLLRELVEPPERPVRLYRAAMRIQPVAALMVLASFLIAKGHLAGVLILGWLVMSLLIAMGGARLARRSKRPRRANPTLIAAHVFLPVGAVWLLFSRLGVRPLHYSALTVLLAALHFHFSGFTLQVLVAATGRALRDSASRLRTAHRWIAIGTIAGIPLIAAGNALSSPGVKVVGVAPMVLAVSGIAATTAIVALRSSSPIVRGLLLVSACSIATGMAVAGVYGAGEFAGQAWIGIPTMVKIHGFLDALGFTVCGLAAHLQTRPSLRVAVTPASLLASRAE